MRSLRDGGNTGEDEQTGRSWTRTIKAALSRQSPSVRKYNVQNALTVKKAEGFPLLHSFY